MSGPLSGLRVLDLTTVVMGPLATQILGDLGAEIIKVEAPGGDSNRYLSPGRHKGMSGMAMTLHRNKRSIVLNLKKMAAQEVLHKLVKQSDILIHNMLPNVVASLQLDYDTLAAINPALIYCTTTGFGDDGKYAGRPAYDDLIQGASGVAALMSKNDEEARYFPGIICDKITGLTAVYAVLAAVIHRNNTGEGQKVTVPMFETMVAFNLLEHIQDTVFQGEASDFGYKRVLSEHRRPYNTKDGLICVLPYSDRNWRSFFSLIGQPELAQDPRFESLPQRTRHIDELYEISAGSLGDKTTQEWLTLFEEAHIAATPIANLADIEQDCHIKTSGFIRPRTHPSAGDYKEIGIPIAYSQSVPDEPTPAPTIGQHSDDILQELGYSAADIAAMGEGVV